MVDLRDMKEKEMYPILEKFLCKKDFKKVPEKKQLQIRKEDMKEDIGQTYVTFDVLGRKDDTIWVIECKKPCTIEQFGFALGQLLYYKFLIEKYFRKKVEEKVGKISAGMYSIALLETKKHPLGNQLKIFESILEENKLTFGFISVKDNEEPQELIEPTKISL